TSSKRDWSSDVCSSDLDLERVLAQDPIAEGVERRDLDVGVAVRHERVDALLHLGGGLVGEGEREDLVRPGPARGDEPGDTSRDEIGRASCRERAGGVEA